MGLFGGGLPGLPDIGGLLGGGGGGGNSSTDVSGGSGFAGGSGTGAGSNSGFGTKQSISQTDSYSTTTSDLTSIDRRIVADTGAFVINAESGTTLNLLMGSEQRDPLASQSTGSLSDWWGRDVNPAQGITEETEKATNKNWYVLAGVVAVAALVAFGMGKK